MSESHMLIEQLVDQREQHLLELRREAESNGRVRDVGLRPGGSPFPIASPKNGYYQQPLLKEPQWTQLIPFYFFVGGAAGSLGVIGSLADIIGGEKKVAEQARWLAFGGSVLSGVLLVTDLGRPSRFLNMLRVFKPQSTMSMGSWILSGFAVFATASSAADAMECLFGTNLLIHLLRGHRAHWLGGFRHALSQLHGSSAGDDGDARLERSRRFAPGSFRYVGPAIRRQPPRVDGT